MKKYSTKKVQQMLKETDNELEKFVLEDVLDRDKAEQLGYMQDVLRHGCQSGTVSSLIYYTDTKAFYIKYMDEIDELYQQVCDETGETLEIGTPAYNWFAWFAYEQTMYNLSNRMELDL